MKRFMNQEYMKHENCIDIFHLIREEKQITRKQIEAVTGMSWGAVSNITARLIGNGFVTEQKPDGNTGPGRTPSYLEVDGSRYCTLGIDVNITGMKAALVNLKSETLKTWSCETCYSSKEKLLGCINRILDQALTDEESKKFEIIGIGVAMQGVVDAENGISVSIAQCGGWDSVPLAALLEERYGISVWLEHDPNCILHAYAETNEVQNAILLRIDRGIGMAVMLDAVISIYNMRKIFHITDIILCGELMESERFFMEPVTRINDRAAFSRTDAGCACYGAAAMALNQAVRKIKL